MDKHSNNEFELWDRNILNVEAKNMARDIDNFYEDMSKMVERINELKTALNRMLDSYFSHDFNDVLSEKEIKTFREMANRNK